jgi:hypothetical protein
VVEYIRSESDTLFDRRVVEAFNDFSSENPELIKWQDSITINHPALHLYPYNKKLLPNKARAFH